MFARGLASIASGRLGFLLVLVCAVTSCVLQLGYSASAVLMTAHATGEDGAWLHAVSDVARKLTPAFVVNHVLLQPAPPTSEQILETHGYYSRGVRGALPSSVGNSTDPEDDDTPVYVVAWFTFNAVAANIFGMFGVFFLCTVDTMRIWEGLCKGWVCATTCQQSCSRPVMDKLKSAQYHVAKAHCLYNLVSQGITAFVTLPHFCPAPCEPQISFSYLGTLGLIISSLKFFEALVHKMAISVETIRNYGTQAWLLCDGEPGHKTAHGVDDRSVRLLQICLGVAQSAESAVQFTRDYLREDVRQGVSLTVGLATFPVQPFGLSISVVGLLLNDMLPKLEKDLTALVPDALKEAQELEKEGEFFYWLAERKYEVDGWRLNVREMTDAVDKMQGNLFKLKALLKTVVGQGLTISFTAKARMSVDDVMRIVDPLIGLLQAQVQQLDDKLHQLGDTLRLYVDKVDAPVDAEVRKLISRIWELRPLTSINFFDQAVPSSLLSQLLSMMDASRAAGADELMLSISTKFLSLAHWAGVQYALDGTAVVDVQVKQEDELSDAGYAAGIDQRFRLLSSGTRYAKLQMTPQKPGRGADLA